jgi:hypothetical protein
MKRATITLMAILLALETAAAKAQKPLLNIEPKLEQMTETGHLVEGGQSVAYLIRRLPVSSFPELPLTIQDVLNLRGCMIPQTYEAHRPENVVHASLERAGSSDWAVLCSAQGTISLLVFFASAPERPVELASAAQNDRLQAHGSGGALGFNWGIDSASPERVHDAQTGLARRPPRPDHDALADSEIDRRTLFRFYSKGKWTVLDMPEQ